LQAARALPAPGWSMRLAETTPELAGVDTGRPNPTEAFLRLARRQVLARLEGDGEVPRGTHETDLLPALPELPDAALTLARALARIAEPLLALRSRLMARLDEEADDMDAATRNRIEATGRSLARRAIDPLSAWQAMLRAAAAPPPEPGRLPVHVHFLRLDRRDTGDRDVGLHRHWLDPTVPFATTLAAPAHGLLVTSATLRDSGGGDPEAAWLAAEERVGAPHLAMPAIRAAVASPFDYASQTRAFVVTDLAAGDPAALAAAYRALFVASGGGGLGLFTAISRLRAVHARIAPALEAAGIPLLAQHVDAMDNATLVDIFRTEEGSCLLGTDAMRDGVDVPGRALRLVVFEKVPWPRPDILHRERRTHLSGGDPKSYDDRAARLRLRQAFGRLIRRAGDRGVFVLLDRRAPSRLLTAFPEGVVVRRVGLAEAVSETAAFLDQATT
jgi:ATP-dependent DNA helicase DinG